MTTSTSAASAASGTAPPGVVVASWLGSTNLGDELLYRALRDQLVARGAAVTGISTDPAATATLHDTSALPHADPRAWWPELRDTRRLVFGGGGLLQDESSRWNVPYHLARVATGRAARARVVAVGLGGGRLHAPSRAAVRTVLGPVPIGARDRATVDQLRGIGCHDVRLTGDLAFSLPRPAAEPEDVLTVCLRPRNVGGGWRPAAGSWRAGLPTPAQLDRLARAVGGAAAAHGLGVRLVAFQADRDGVLHDELATRLAGVDVEVVTPDVDQVLGVVARSRVVLAMRFHAAVAGVLGGVPVVAAAYSSKVAELAADAPASVTDLAVPLAELHPDHLAAALAGHPDRRAAELAALIERERGNGRLLDDLLAG